MTPLGMTISDISSHLLEDWVPSLPSVVSSAFMGWPLYLIDVNQFQPIDYLVLREEIRNTERQWKGFLSWMLGIAGTRHVLAKEGYRWIAPASAFYPNSSHSVSIYKWNPAFPPGIVTVTLPSNPKSRLRPDYLAIRMKNGKYDWAVVESKGTSRCLTNTTSCPPDWRRQVRNIEVKVNGNKINVPRHIVVATRSNPNAVLNQTRRLQVRAWNSTDQTYEQELPYFAVADIIAAHLFGLFRNMGFIENARALSYSVMARAMSITTENISESWRETLSSVRKLADSELEQMTHLPMGSSVSRTRSLDTEFGSISFEISEATISLASRLSISVTQEEVIETLKDTESKIEEWNNAQKETRNGDVLLQSGVRVSFHFRSLNDDILSI